MKVQLFILIFLFAALSLFSQNKIPDSIKGELTLKPTAKPYESSGFTVEKGATLTILPGTKINLSAGADKYCNIVIKGTIKIGDKGPAKCKPVVFEGYSPWIKFDGAIIEINSLNVTLVNCQFVGDNTGILCNTNLYRNQLAIPYPFIVCVPSKGNLTITDCLIEDQGMEVRPNKFPDDIANLTITKCAFTYTLHQNKDSYFYKKCNTNIYVFAYGTKCDSYADILFTAFDWKIINSISTEWYIESPDLRKTLDGSAKAVSGFSLKLETKPLTGFKQALLPPPAKAPGKEKK
jgi:hypothetical protein